MRVEQRTTILTLLWLLFATIEQSQAFAARSRSRIRGISPYKSRRLNEETEIKVRAEDKIGDKIDKGDDKEESVATDLSTTSPTWTPTSSPSSSPSTPVTMGPTVDVPARQTLEPSSRCNSIPSISAIPTALVDNTTSQAQVMWRPNADKVGCESDPDHSLPAIDLEGGNSTGQAEDVLTPTSDSVESDSNSTLLSPTVAGTSTNSTVPEAHPNPLDTSPSPESKSSPGGVVGLILGLCSVAFLGSFYFVAKRRKHRKDLSRDDKMLEVEEAEHSFPPSPANMRQLKWSDVVHHSLMYEEKIELAPACTTKSMFLPSITEKTEEEDDREDLQDVTLSPSKRPETVYLRPVIKDEDPTPTATSRGFTNLEERMDLYTQTIVNLMDCGITEDDGEEKKCQEAQDLRSVNSEDLEYMYGTLPSDLLPATPRTSNVSLGGKPEGSQLTLLPNLLTHRPEVKTEREREECDLHWV